MSHAGVDDEHTVVNLEDKSVRLVYPHTPPTAEFTFERLGLANAIITIPVNALDELIDTPERLTVA